MHLAPKLCYRAVQARDGRYDGRFFTCVKTTRIFCRPICPARPPKFENCLFVPTAAAAQEAGFRPCLRCRPESSPNLDAWRGTEATVSRALRLIETGALDQDGVVNLADRLGIGSRQLRRLFRQHVGATPIAVAQTRRILLAKQLLHETNLPMIEVALASGFGSVRRFNEAFQRLYDRPPSQLRRRPVSAAPSGTLSILLPYKAPYDWNAMLGFLAARAIGGLEVVTPDGYRRTFDLDGQAGSIHISNSPQHSALRATIDLPRSSALPAIIARIRRQFDLGAEPLAISAALAADPLLAPLVAARPGMRVPGAWDGFEIAVRAVLGQQISVRAATRLATQLVAALGQPVKDRGADELTHTFPRPEQFTAQALSRLKMPRARLAALDNLARAAQADPYLFDPRSDLPEAVSRLRQIEGIGPWTAQYIAMRALGESDAFLAGDAALRRTLAMHGWRSSPAELSARSEAWRPWRAYALLHLWASQPKPPRTAQPERIYDALTA